MKRATRPVETAGSMENACGVSHSPLDGAQGAAHSYHRLYDYEGMIHKLNCPRKRGSFTLL